MIFVALAIHEETNSMYCLCCVGGDEREEREENEELHFDDTVYSNYMVSIFKCYDIKLKLYLFR